MTNTKLSTWKATQQVLAMTVAREKQNTTPRVNWSEVRSSVIATIESQDLQIQPETVDLCISMAEKSMASYQAPLSSTFFKEINADKNVKHLFQLLENFNIGTMESRWETFKYLSHFCFWKECKKAFAVLVSALLMTVVLAASFFFISSASTFASGIAFVLLIVTVTTTSISLGSIYGPYSTIQKIKQSALESIKKEGWQGSTFICLIYTLFQYAIDSEEVNKRSLAEWVIEEPYKNHFEKNDFYSPVDPVSLINQFKQSQEFFPEQVREKLSYFLSQWVENDSIGIGHFWVWGTITKSLSAYFPQSKPNPRNLERAHEALALLKR